MSHLKPALSKAVCYIVLSMTRLKPALSKAVCYIVSSMMVWKTHRKPALSKAACYIVSSMMVWKTHRKPALCKAEGNGEKVGAKKPFEHVGKVDDVNVQSWFPERQPDVWDGMSQITGLQP